MAMGELVVSELVSNAYKYAPGPCLLCDGAVEISVWGHRSDAAVGLSCPSGLADPLPEVGPYVPLQRRPLGKRSLPGHDRSSAAKRGPAHLYPDGVPIRPANHDQQRCAPALPGATPEHVCPGQKLPASRSAIASQAEGSSTAITRRPPWLALVDGIGSVVRSVGDSEAHARLVGRRTRRRG